MISSTLFLLLIILSKAISFNTGFWYRDTRPPFLQYETVAYANMTVRILRPYQDGPGQNLVQDPVDSSNLYVGNTINRQTFDTQFILDLSYAIGIEVERIYVQYVSKGTVHYAWESSSVIVNFIFLERNSTSSMTLLEAIAELTNQIQDTNSLLYKGTNVTVDVDLGWGLQVLTWDVSLKLTYAIDIVGGNAVMEGYYLDQGSLGICDIEGAANYSTYCEFERFFEDDVSRALNISYYRVQVLFIKSSSLDSVLVSFRINPPAPNSKESNNTMAIANLQLQVADISSELYKGNVTIRTDPTWGVNQFLSTPRTQAALFTQKYYEYDETRISNEKRMSMITAYDRCKANRRCNWGITELNQTSNDARFFHRLFDEGNLYEVQLFLDFEDWRMGSRGFSWNGYIPPTDLSQISIPKARASISNIRGAHFWPFDFASLGPDIPCYRSERNQGLVLDRSLQYKQVITQESFVDDLIGRIDWMELHIEDAIMGPKLRSRKDVKSQMRSDQYIYYQWYQNEVTELKELNSSQCVQKNCFLLFNTSSLELTGAISDKGIVYQTSNGTEVALFVFNSIYLGPELYIEVVGQRALALISKTSFILNTTIEIQSGTLGGFQGGGSVARLKSDMYNDDPTDIFICDLNDYCSYNTSDPNSKRTFDEELVSNNVNGPGSGNVRINPFIIKTGAEHIPEIQTITTLATPGQLLSGGFVLKFKSFQTPIIPHDVSSLQLKRIIEDNLNLINPSSLPVTSLRSNEQSSGIGIVNVTRSAPDSQEGFTWTITFTTAIGNIEQLQVKSYLFGLGASSYTSTLRDGNELGGTFTLSFLDYTTSDIPISVTADGLRDKLLDLPIITDAFVRRTDPTGNCDDGLCENGPYPARGLLWTIYVTSTVDLVTPTSPTSSLALKNYPNYHFVLNNASITGINQTAVIYYGTSNSPDSPLDLLNVTIPFSLAYGGAGASYGGNGGKGFGSIPVGPLYNDELITDLVGGSGGCMSLADPFEINAALGSVTGRGGHGGGAIELIAANDIVIGNYGKIFAIGGDGEQSSGGGGGGGSGGTILLSSGTNIVIEGSLNASGGSGGYGGSSDETLSGGGGGGGRIALYADSITIIGNITANGGPCGILKEDIIFTLTSFNISTLFALSLPLDDDRLSYLSKLHVGNQLPTALIHVNDIINKTISNSSIIYTTVSMTISFSNTTNMTFSSGLELIKNALNNATNINIAEVTLISSFIEDYYYSNVTLETKTQKSCSNSGSTGTIYTEALMTTSMYVRSTISAEGTTKGLFMSNRETTNTTSGSTREAPYAWNGPVVPFEPSRPSRITYYTKIDPVAIESKKFDYGSLFTLISHGESGLNISNVIGVYFGSAIMHGANFGSAVDEKVFLKRMVTIDPYPIVDKWYKVDIKIQWDNHTYLVALNDTIVTYNQQFVGDDVDGIRLSVYRAIDVWYDEIYIGFDNSMNFQCPISNRKGTSTSAPKQKGWSFEEVHGGSSNGYTEYQKMMRHYNFLDTTGSIAFDGSGAVQDFQDIKLQYADGDYAIDQGKIHAGALVYLTNSLRSHQDPLPASATMVTSTGIWAFGDNSKNDGRQYWYTEYDYNSTFADVLNGGVAACSTQDLINWRFEGIVFHYVNLSDLVYGSDGPFYVERPKVLFNSLKSEYVMWAAMDSSPNRSLAMSMIASSPYEDGPFLFRRSFYPDGNTTRDQVIFSIDSSQTVLGRTYYQTVEYVLPQAMMQPVWESAKSSNGTINYRSNYHRAYYDIGYDNYNDIYLQRWRKEDVEYQVICENKITGVQRVVPSGTYNSDGFVCDDPSETKIIIGQGNPIITTRFVSPNDSSNSWWRPTSVPSVVAQDWSANYRDGYCGIRKLNDDYSEDDPNLATFNPSDRSTCSNIADNPIHDTLQDKLIGVLKVILTRRAKFIAISGLTPDYLDTNGYLSSFEGELESGNLISLIVELGQFGFSSGSSINSTFNPPRRSEYDTAVDYRIRFSQYIQNYNDRASYSLACVLDGVCSVNFKDQLTTGQT